MLVCRLHRSRPRLVLPDQEIHFSAFPGDMYTPRATLGYGVNIPIVSQKVSGALWTTAEPWTTGRLASLLSDQQRTLKSLCEVLFLLRFSTLRPLSTHQRHTSDAFKPSRDRKWTDSNNTHTTVVGDIHSRAVWF